MSKPQCRVAEDYQIEYTEVACRSQDRLGCRGDSEPIYEVHRERLSVATDQQPRPPRTRISVEHGSEDGVGDGGWQPPAPKPSGRQVRESSGSRQHQLPCRQFLELGTAQCRGVHPTRDAFPLPASEPPPYGRARRVLDCHAGRIRTRARIVREPTHLWTAGGTRPLLWKTGHLLSETGHPPRQVRRGTGWE